jgi:hypothetical protein
LTIWFQAHLLTITYVLSTQMGHASAFLNIYVPRDSTNIINYSIQWISTLIISFWIFENPSGLQLPKWNSFQSVGVHSLTLSYIPGNMKCDSQASTLAYTFASPCLGYEPKVRIVTMKCHKHKNNQNKIFPKVKNEPWQRNA